MYNIKEEYCANQNGIDCIETCSCWQAVLQIKYKNIVQKCKINVSISKENEFHSKPDLYHSNDNTTLKNSNGYSNSTSSSKMFLQDLPISTEFFTEIKSSNQIDTFTYSLELNLINNEALKKLTEVNSQFSLCKFDIFINSNVHSEKMFDKNLHISLDPFIILKSIEMEIEKYKQKITSKNKDNSGEISVRLLNEKTNVFIYFNLARIKDFATFIPSLENLLVQNINITKLRVELKIPKSILIKENLSIDFNCPEFFPKREIHYNSINDKVFIENMKENININNFLPSPRLEKAQILNFKSNDFLSSNIDNYNKNFIKSSKKNQKKNKKKESNVKLFVRRLETKAINEPISIKPDDNYCNESKNEYSIYSLKAKNLGNFNKFDLANKEKQIPIITKKNDKDFLDKKLKAETSRSKNDNVFAGKNEIKIKISNQIQNNYIINHTNNQFLCSQGLNIHYNNININQYQESSNNYLINNYSTNPIYFDPKPVCNYHQRNENLCNVDIFMTNSTPIYLDSENTLIKDILFSFEKASILGLECVLKNSGISFLSHYTPTLSTLKIEVLAKKENLSPNIGALSYNTNTLINFSEDQNLSNRLILIDKLEEIFESIPELYNISLSNLAESSYFTLLWTPTKSNRGFYNSTSFLVFYKFREKFLTNTLRALSVVGMISNITDDDFWFKNQMTPYNNFYMNDSIYNKLVKDFIENKCKYLQIKDSCHEFIKQNRSTNNNADCNTISEVMKRKTENFLIN